MITEAEAEDHPVSAHGADETMDLFRAVQPAVDEARRTYPQAKARYEAGLPAGSHFFLTVRLRGEVDQVEQVFVLVDAIRRERVHGRIWSEVELVQSYRREQEITFEESEIIWTILDAEGREEGNFVGKLIDQLSGTTH